MTSSSVASSKTFAVGDGTKEGCSERDVGSGGGTDVGADQLPHRWQDNPLLISSSVASSKTFAVGGQGAAIHSASEPGEQFGVSCEKTLGDSPRILDTKGSERDVDSGGGTDFGAQKLPLRWQDNPLSTSSSIASSKVCIGRDVGSGGGTDREPEVVPEPQQEGQFLLVHSSYLDFISMQLRNQQHKQTGAQGVQTDFDQPAEGEGVRMAFEDLQSAYAGLFLRWHEGMDAARRFHQTANQQIDTLNEIVGIQEQALAEHELLLPEAEADSKKKKKARGKKP